MSARPSRAAAVAAVEKSRARERASSEAMERLNETDPLTDGEVESSEGTEDKESEERDSEEEEGSDDDDEEEEDLEIDDVSGDGSVAEVGLGEEEVGADEVPAAVPPADGDENAIAGAGNFAEALSVLLSSAASAIKRDGKLTVAAAASVVSRAWDLAGGLVPDQGFLQGLLPERVEHRILEEETITDGMREQMDQVPGRAVRESAMAGGGEHVRAAGFSSNNSNVVDDDDSENEENEEDEHQASKQEMMKMVEEGTFVLDENTEWNDENEAAHRG